MKLKPKCAKLLKKAKSQKLHIFNCHSNFRKIIEITVHPLVLCKQKVYFVSFFEGGTKLKIYSEIYSFLSRITIDIAMAQKSAIPLLKL